MRWLKNTKGTPDSMLTFALGGFVVTIVAILGSMIDSFTWGKFSMDLQVADTTMVTAFLGATLLAYVNRRNKKDDHDHEIQKEKIRLGIIE